MRSNSPRGRWCYSRGCAKASTRPCCSCPPSHAPEARPRRTSRALSSPDDVIETSHRDPTSRGYAVGYRHCPPEWRLRKQAHPGGTDGVERGSSAAAEGEPPAETRDKRQGPEIADAAGLPRVCGPSV